MTMRYLPRPGRAIVRRIEAEDRLGSLIIPQQAISRMTAQQVELVAVGEPDWVAQDDVPPAWWPAIERGQVETRLVRGRWEYRRPHPAGLVPGAWCVLRGCALFPTHLRHHYVVTTDQIVAVIT